MFVKWKCSQEDWCVPFVELWLLKLHYVDAFNKMDADMQEEFLRHQFD